MIIFVNLETKFETLSLYVTFKELVAIGSLRKLESISPSLVPWPSRRARSRRIYSVVVAAREWDENEARRGSSPLLILKPKMHPAQTKF